MNDFEKYALHLFRDEPKPLKSYETIFKDENGNAIEKKTFIAKDRETAIDRAINYARLFVPSAKTMSVGRGRK